MDIVILDFEPDLEVPFILRRPFLSTGGSLNNVEAGRLKIRAHDKVEVFDVYKALTDPAIYEDLSAIISIGQDIEGYVESQELSNVLNVPNVSVLIKFTERLTKN